MIFITCLFIYIYVVVISYIWLAGLRTITQMPSSVSLSDFPYASVEDARCYMLLFDINVLYIYKFDIYLLVSRLHELRIGNKFVKFDRTSPSHDECVHYSVLFSFVSRLGKKEPSEVAINHCVWKIWFSTKVSEIYVFQLVPKVYYSVKCMNINKHRIMCIAVYIYNI